MLLTKKNNEYLKVIFKFSLFSYSCKKLYFQKIFICFSSVNINMDYSNGVFGIDKIRKINPNNLNVYNSKHKEILTRAGNSEYINNRN